MASKKGTTDEDYLRAAWDWAAEAAKTEPIGVRITLTPTDRRGIWKLSAQAVDVVDGRVVSCRVKYDIKFPGASHQTLAGAILAGLLKLEHELAEDELALQPPI